MQQINTLGGLLEEFEERGIEIDEQQYGESFAGLLVGIMRANGGWIGIIREDVQSKDAAIYMCAENFPTAERALGAILNSLAEDAQAMRNLLEEWEM